MSKKQYRSQASSSRAISGAFGTADGALASGAFGSPSTFGAVSSSPLSYIFEPPDLSSISEPNIVVLFKNLQKKDGTTKSKALEDLQAYILSLSAEGGVVEDSILEAWIVLYPRASIDCARRVRQLAHSFQGHISASCGKRIAKSMPKVIGPWLAGSYDNDRSVSRTALESLKQVFPSAEKLANLWRLYQGPIIVYSLDAITKETVNTLSDERTTSPDDAFAKHARVVATSILLVTRLIDNSFAEDTKKDRTLLYGFLAEDKLWRFASHADAFVRRSVYRLLIAALTKLELGLDIKAISNNILSSSLQIDQAGSAFDYSKALALVTRTYPEVWTTYYTGTGKKSASKRLSQFLKRGSQGSPPDYWSYISVLLRNVPEALLDPISDSDGTAKMSDDVVPLGFPVLDAIHSGLCSKDEPRTNLSVAWKTYLEISGRVQLRLAKDEAVRFFCNEYILPIVKQYIMPSQEGAGWTLPRTEQLGLCVQAFLRILRATEALMHDAWRQLSAKFVESIKTSSPEQSKDYAKSQKGIADESLRWYGLQAAIMEEDTSKSIKSLFLQTSKSELQAAMESLRTRNGKPYGAAAALVAALQFMPDLVEGDTELKRLVVNFVREDLPKLFVSPSASRFVTILDLMTNKIDTRQIYRVILKSLLEAPDSTAKSDALESVLASEHLELADDDILLKTINIYLQAALAGDNSGWKIVLVAMRNPAVPASLVDQFLSTIIDTTATDRVTAGLYGMQLMTKENERSLQLLSRCSDGPQLLSRLLSLATSPDEAIAQDARSITTALESYMSSGQSLDQASRSRREIINRGLDSPTEHSLPVEALVGQARKLFEQGEEKDKEAITAEILPTTTQWHEALSPFLASAPNPSLAVTNSLSCAITLIESPSKFTHDSRNAIARDADGYSSALRILYYVTRLIQELRFVSYCTEEVKVSLVINIALLVQIATDHIAIPTSKGLWDASLLDVDADVVSLLAEAQNLIATWIEQRPKFVTLLQQQLLEMSAGRSVLSYYSARAYSAITAELKELHGNAPDNSETSALQKISKSRNAELIFQTSALLSSASESNQLTKLTNEFLANLTDHDFRMEDGLRLLLLFNCILYRQETIASNIPKQRLVFFVKHIVSQCQEHALAASVRTEIFRVLLVILPCIEDIYGDFWEGILRIIRETWSNLKDVEDSDISLVDSSLRLLSVLRSLVGQEANDELTESWADGASILSEGLVGLVNRLQVVSDESSQPRMTTNELLSRQLSKMPPEAVSDPKGLYPVLGSSSVALQTSAYRMLHNHIPKAQEQVSLNKALSKDYTTHLPEELLSLILAPPSNEMLSIADFQRSIPASLRSYLLSWKLVYDHWKGSSYAVQADYTTSLKDGVYLKTLLEFISGHLITGRSRPVDASKLDPWEFSPDQEDSPEKDMQHFLIHLYALSLTCVPNLSKTWWRDSTSRQTMLAVESWTEKYISPLIIASELSTVSAWGPSQADADQPLTIKVSTSTHEITASIPIDEQTMSIAIRLPGSYPLQRATVDSIHRVGVDERKWRSWIITTQGVINFSNEGNGGSLVEGLLAWRKNVTATLKGQTECAICYSVPTAKIQQLQEMAAADTTDDVDALLSVPEELVPSRNEELQPTISLDFDGLLSQPLVLKQDLKEGCGGKTWPAGMVLAEYLLRCKLHALEGKTMLELGSGSGLVGLAIALGLASCSTTSLVAQITVSDVPSMLSLLEENIALNPCKTSVQSLPLSWGEPIPVSVSSNTPEVVLAADCCYYEPAFPLLLDTIEELLSGNPDACCYFCFKKRRKADLGFVKLARKRFDVQDGAINDPKRQESNWGEETLIELFGSVDGPVSLVTNFESG